MFLVLNFCYIVEKNTYLRQKSLRWFFLFIEMCFFSVFSLYICKLYNRLIWKNSIEIAIISRRNGPRCSCLKPIKILDITSVSKKISKCNNLKLILAHFYNEAKIRFVLICYIVSGRTSDSCKWYFVTKIVLTYCEKKLF